MPLYILPIVWTLLSFLLFVPVYMHMSYLPCNKSSNLSCVYSPYVQEPSTDMSNENYVLRGRQKYDCLLAIKKAWFKSAFR